MNSPIGDLTFGFRVLWKDKAYSLATILTLALCIGANTALFSIVNSVLLRPLPAPRAERLVFVYNSYPKAGAERGGSGVPDYLDRVKGAPALESLALYTARDLAIGERGRPERVPAMDATPSYFRVLGAKAELGRTFEESEGEIGRNDKVILSDGLWRDRFGADPGIVGRQVRIDSRPYTVVGVMPAAFRFSNARLWRPLAFTPEQKSDENRHNNSWSSIGRLRDGATLAQARSELDALNAASLELMPALKPLLLDTGFHTEVVPLQQDIVRNVKGTLFLLWGGTLFVLLIGCVNVVNLALARSRARVRELATRFALGAGRWRVARQLFTESLMLTVASGTLGLLLGWGALRLLGAADLAQIPRGGEIRLDVLAVAFTLGLALLLGAAIGAFPLAGALGVNLSSVFHEGGRTGTGGRGPRLLRRALVVSQVAVAFVLLLGSGLLVASFRQILAIDPGFDPRQVLTASVTLPRSRYPGDDEARAFAAAALERLRRLPGVMAAGATASIPFGDDHSDSVILAEGYQMRPGESLISPTRVEVSPGYFEAMKIPLRRGRYFEERDAKDAPRVVIVDARLARKFWPGADPVGRRMFRPEKAEDLLAPGPKATWFTVVGVVGEIKQDALVSAREPVGAYYFPIAQEPIRGMTFAVRTATEPATIGNLIRREVAAVDPELPVFAVKTMDEWASDSLVTRRWPVLLSVGFGVVALLLSAVGIYGVLAYLVTQRTKEIGIRMALGGTPRAIFDLVLTEGVALLAAGFVAGAAGALVVKGVIETQLYGVRVGDPLVVSASVLLLGLVALVASVLPARRATRIDPVLALNRE